MRKDVVIEIFFRKDGEKLNISEEARRFGCCWRTIDKRVHPEKYKNKEKKARTYTSILDQYKSIIDQKLEDSNIPATGIYFLLKQKYEFTGSYSTVKRYVSKIKKKIIKDLTIRFETVPGYQSQVDWKESMTLYNKHGVKFKINIFLIVNGYSRMKFIKLTSDRIQDTLLICLTEAFIYFGGTTEEILFDNMKTVVDHAKSEFNKVVINDRFSKFAKDAGFKIFTCRAYRPMTKGRVETLAKVMNRLKAFNYEFETWEDLNKIVNDLLYELNYVEKSQATNEEPYKRMKKEKEYLIPVNIDLLKSYVKHETKYKVSKESMVTYQGKKYSVPITYIGEELSIVDNDEFINIYYNINLICSYEKNISKRFNYKKDDYLDILKHSVYFDKTHEEIAEIALNNKKSLNEINIEE